MIGHRLVCLELPPRLLEQVQAKLFLRTGNTGSRRGFYPCREQSGGGPYPLGQQNCHLQIIVCAKVFNRSSTSGVERTGQLHVNNLGLDAALFLINFKFINFVGCLLFIGVFVNLGAFL